MTTAFILALPTLERMRPLHIRLYVALIDPIRWRFCYRVLLSVVIFLLWVTPGTSLAAVQCSLEFAPQEGVVKPQEHPYRAEVCLNGAWRFQPVGVPQDFKPNLGIPPELPPPTADGWSTTPIKIPSHWNANLWGGGRLNRKNPNLHYWPDSVYFPSYPTVWDTAEMGWLQRDFAIPKGWNEQRIILRFEAVAGQCQVVLNGRKLAEHFDNYLPFELDVTDAVRWDGANELQVGLRSQNLFNKTSGRYPKFSATNPPGSVTESLVGIWQDVFLLALPKIHITDTFVKPLVKQGFLEIDVTVLNTGTRDQTLQIEGDISPWVNLAGKEARTAPVPKWRLDPAVLSLPGAPVTVKAGQQTVVTIRQLEAAQLSLWTPETPHLYGLVLTLNDHDKTVDRQYTRFGWRELSIEGKNFVLNGQKVKLMAEWAHPFGAYIMSPRYVWAWYQMIKDFGGNSVRPHAQIHPRFYLDLADEMGILVLEETAIFGSSIRLNTGESVFWERCEKQYDGMVLRDRNHPSVMGWSFANEMFAIPRGNKMSSDEAKTFVERLVDFSSRSLALDPTRTWITSDGDEDLNGALPVWSKHFGVGNYANKLPLELNKPLAVGESGGAYFATPEQLSVFNGDRAYESYLGRNEALAIDLYDNVVNMALPHLAYFSTRQIVWWGIEQLPLGYADFFRLPNETDGVFFNKSFQEGKPGMQPERIPPYATTLNPGWDSALPLYKPLPVFHALKAALAPGGPLPCAWDHKAPPVPNIPHEKAFNVEQVSFLGPEHSPLLTRLHHWGVSIGERKGMDGEILVVDGQTLNADETEQNRDIIRSVTATGGTVLVMLYDMTAPVNALNKLLPAPLALTSRQSSLLVATTGDEWTNNLAIRNLNFSGMEGDRFILKCGLAGELTDSSQVSLAASNTDWALFNNMPQKAKASAVLLYEQLQKPSGAALVRISDGKGTLSVSSLDYRLNTPATHTMWRQLFANIGLKLKNALPPEEVKSSKKKDKDPLFLNEK